MEEKNECSVCEKSFKTPTALKGHKTRFHKTEEIESLEGKVVSFPEKKKEKQLQIMIHNVEGEFDYAFVRVTGKDTISKSFRIQRGEWVTVPEVIVNILRDATVETFKYEPDENIPGKFTKRPVSYTKYPMSVKEVAAV